MKKALKSIALVMAFTFITFASISSSVYAAETRAFGDQKVVKTYDYDYNTVLGQWTNWHNPSYIVVPAEAKFSYDSKTRISSGWNYDRYRIINYYYGNGKYY